MKSARATARAGDANLEAAQQDLIVRVASAYFAVLTAEDALKFAQSNEQALNRQMEQAQQRFEVGLSAITDVNDAKAQHDTAVANVITAQNVLDDNREALRQLTNKPPGELRKLRENLPLDKPVPEDPEQWVGVAVNENPALASYAYQLDAANADINTSRAGHLPTINGSISYAKSPSATCTRPDERALQQGRLVDDGRRFLNVPIFAGGYTQSACAESTTAMPRRSSTNCNVAWSNAAPAAQCVAPAGQATGQAVVFVSLDAPRPATKSARARSSTC